MAQTPYAYPQYQTPTAPAWPAAAYQQQQQQAWPQQYAPQDYYAGYAGYYQQYYAPPYTTDAGAQQVGAYYQQPPVPEPPAESSAPEAPPPPPESEAPPLPPPSEEAPPPPAPPDTTAAVDSTAAAAVAAAPAPVPAAAAAAAAAPVPATVTTTATPTTATANAVYPQQYTDGQQQYQYHPYQYDPYAYAAYNAQYAAWQYPASAQVAPAPAQYPQQPTPGADSSATAAQTAYAPSQAYQAQQYQAQSYQSTTSYQAAPAYQTPSAPTYQNPASTLPSVASGHLRPSYASHTTSAQTASAPSAPWHQQTMPQQPTQQGAAVTQTAQHAGLSSQQQARMETFVIKKQMSKAYTAAASMGSSISKAPEPAYTKVEVQPRPSPAAQAAAAASAGQANAAGKKLAGYPPALQSYVERAFQSVQDAEDKKAMADRMKEIIQEARQKGELWTRDWDKVKLPSLRDDSPPPTVTQRAAGRWPADRTDQRPANGGRSNDWKKGLEGRETWQAQGRGRGRNNKAAGRHSRAAQDYDRDHDSDSMSSGSQDAGYHGVVARMDSSGRDGILIDAFKKQKRQDRFGASPPAGRPPAKMAKIAGRGRGLAQASRFQPQQRRRVLEVDSDDETALLESTVVKGTCTNLEKSYFRLTSAPDPATVRPEPVLVQALARLVGLLRDRSVNYFYANDQFKGMRQDCTVQHLRNELAAAVYEGHARAALEYGDLADFNQCQTQLHMLYGDGVRGARAEFVAYRLLYAVLHARQGEARQLLTVLRNIPPELQSHPAVAHAMRVRAALAERNFPRFFRLYTATPALGRAILDSLVPKARFCALTGWVKALRPTVPVTFVAAALGFVQQTSKLCTAGGGGSSGAEAAASDVACLGSSAGGDGAAEGEGGGEVLPGCMEPFHRGRNWPEADMEDGVAACIAWLQSCNAVVQQEPGKPDSVALLDCKASSGHLTMPEEKKVAHGDVNMSIDDFLAKVL